ncbi:BnaA09g08820D [Brassica napus]|uniref:(rape) hypothetical protein n=1 Tax=Brassica napus TaxID=3708 RepID=A0A078IE70_BRANA|nr:unnamed protein product [Brassica napus]CDY47473.1 BnaA09g08820D [Brassica napus]
MIYFSLDLLKLNILILKREKTRGREAPTYGGAYARVPAPVAPFLSILARFSSVRVDLLSYPIYFRIWNRVLSSEEICLRRVSNGGNLSFSGFVTRVCSLVGGREKRPYQVGDVSVSRGCYSGVCSNGGGDDLAPAIDLAGKDFSRVQDGGGEECV